MMPLQLLLRMFDLLRPPKRVVRAKSTVTKQVLRKRHNDPALRALWLQLRLEYFPFQPEIDAYTVYWSSRRQKRVLACCNIRRREVKVAKELSSDAASRWLRPILYHEMCHAALGLSLKRKKGKMPWHGQEFKELVVRHPETDLLETWIKTGGWASAVRSERSRAAAKKRKVPDYF